MKHLSIDIETFSSVDLKSAGLYRYVESPDFSILLFAYSVDYGPVQLVDLASGEHLPPEIITALQDPAVIKHAYNAAFEINCISKFLPTPADQWHCTMVHGTYCGYPAGLAAAVIAAGLPADKRKSSTGAALIRLFCLPNKPTKANGGRTRTLPHHEPEKWQIFKDYCRQDVVAEMGLAKHLEAWPLPDTVQQEWATDQEINSRGIGVDRELVEGAIWCSTQIAEELTREAVQISGLDNPNSTKQLTVWLEEETGEEVENLQKATVSAMIPNVSSDAARRMLEIRQELSLASVKKYEAMAKVAGEDSRARGTLQFYGANRTGRWAGRLIQLQNLTKHSMDNELLPYARALVARRNLDGLKLLFGNVPSALSQLVRTAFIPSRGNRLIVADFSAIEARVIAWLAGEEWRQEVFATHGKIYEASAATMFGVPIATIAKGQENYNLRQKGKVAELALGYQGGPPALIRMGALAMGLAEDELPEIVHRWRSSNKRITDLWYSVEATALSVMKTGQPQACRGIFFAHEADGSGQHFFTIALPSGRKLFYARPQLGINARGKECLQYYEKNGQRAGSWGLQDTYGGRLVENITQAIARDCLAVAIERAAAAGYHPVMHVHDEIICDDADGNVNHLCGLMSEPMPWAPGLLLKAAGFEAQYYMKD